MYWDTHRPSFGVFLDDMGLGQTGFISGGDEHAWTPQEGEPRIKKALVD